MSDLAAWPALVLTAGFGTRLAPLSDVRAKAAMPIAGRPLISRILAWLRAAGVRRVVMNLHHRPETITRIVGDGSPWDLEVRYSWEPTLLGSAGGPSRAIPLLDADRFFVVNGDTLTDCSLPAVAERHLASQALVTLAVVAGDVDRYGGVAVDAEDRITGFVPRRQTPHTSAPDARPLHFIGVQAVEARTFRDVPADRPSETIRTLYPQLLAASTGAMAAFRSDASFLDVGTPRDYFETVVAVARAEGVPLDRGERVRIDTDARITETIVWNDVRIDAGTRLTRCIVADGVTVATGTYEGQVLVATGDGQVRVTPI